MKKKFAHAAVAVVLAVLFTGCASSPQAKRDKYMERGKALMAKKDYPRAILEFRNAARAMPGDAEVYYQIGMAYLATSDVRTAYAALKKAVDLNPRHTAAQLKIAQMLAVTRDPALLKDAEGRLQALLDGGSGTAEVLNALAFTELQLGKTEEGIRNYETAVAKYPGELTASIMLAKARLFQGDRAGAEQILKKACADAPKSADARRVLAEFYMAQNNPSLAEGELRNALALDAKSGASLFDMARLLLALGRKAEAEQAFKQLCSMDGYKPVFAVFLLNQGRGEEAVREFQRLARESPDDRAARTRLVVAYRRLGRFQEADAVLSQALKRNPKDADALLQSGEIALQAGKFDKAEVDFNQVMKLKPTAAEVHYLMAKLYDARSDKRLYRQELNAALELNPMLVPIRVELARDLILQNDGKGALDVLDAAPAAQKQLPAVLVQRAWALWATGDLAGMRRGIDQLMAQGRTPDALILDGLWKLRAGDRKGARATAEEALKINPEDVRALRVMNRTYLPQEAPVALQKVKEMASAQPKSAGVQDFLGLMLLGDGKWEEARSAFEAAKSADPKMVDAQLSLVQVDVMEKKLDDARNHLQALLASNSGNLTIRRWLGNVEVMRGDNDAALEQFRKVADANPGDAQAANNLAYLLIEHSKRLDEGLKYAQKAVEIAPNNPSYCDTLGWAYYSKGLYSSAIPYLERASRSSDNAVWKYHLAMAYAKAGDLSRGRATLAAARKQNSNIPEAKTAAELVGISR